MKGYIDTKGHDKPPCGTCKYKTMLMVESPCYNCISVLNLALHKANAETEFASYEPRESEGQGMKIKDYKCEHCSKTYGTLGCCDTVNNEWVYSCKEGHEEYARGIRKFGSTTKNDLGVDCVLRADVNQVIEDYVDEQYHVLSDKTKERAFGANAVKARINELPSVTQKPKTGHWLVDESPESDREIICSNCEQPIFRYYKLNFDYRPNYCPNCGAKMVDPQESEDNKW